MPNRIVREGILTSERVNRIADDPAAEVFYRRIHSVVDDYGRHSAHPSLLRAACYPLRLDKTTYAEVLGYLQACEAAGLITTYQAEGKPFLEVLDFRQRTRAAKSKCPPPEGRRDIPGSSGAWHAADSRPSNDGQLTVIGPSCDRPPQAESESYSETESETEKVREPENSWEEFRQSYPEPKRNVRIEPSCRAYIGRIDGKRGEHEKLMDGLRRHLVCDQWVRSLRDDGGRYVPSMERFIAEGVYNDSPPVYSEEVATTAGPIYRKWSPPELIKDEPSGEAA